MATVYEYKIYCETEAAYVTGLSKTEPTVCFNNNTHTVNTASVQIIDTISSNLVSIKEDKLDVGRNTWVESIDISNVDANQTVSVSFTFPIAVSMYSFTFITDSTNKGDYLSIYANEDTTLGLIGADLNIGVTSMTGPAGLILYGVVGFHITVTDGTNTDYLGIIKSIDKVTNIVTFEHATTHSFSSANTLVKMTVRVLDDLRICGSGIYRFFDDVIGGAAIPAGTVAKFSYTNNSGSENDKFLSIYMTCLY